MATVTSPLGTLSVLPRELRDEIYCYAIGNGAVFQFKNPKTLKHHELRTKWESESGGDNLAILRSSRRIRQEALAFLSAGVFKFKQELGVFDELADRHKVEDFDWLAQGDIPFFDHLSNIQYVVPWLEIDHDTPSPLTLNTKAGHLSLFTGAKYSRNTCEITFRSCEPDLPWLLESPSFNVNDSHIFGAVTELIDFKFVRVILQLHDFPWRKVYDEGMEEHDEEVAKMVRMVASTFEPYLGPFSVEEQERKYSEINSGLSWTDPQWVITYHPHDHLNQQSVRTSTQ